MTLNHFSFMLGRKIINLAFVWRPGEWHGGNTDTLVAIKIKNMKCKLCNLDKPLIGKSHIISDFLYKKNNLYDDKHRLTKFSIEEIKNSKKLKKVQSGIYEGNLLCQECDNVIIGQYEKYAANALFDRKLEISDCPVCKKIGNDSFHYSDCKNFNYKYFKLFILSILFRASICSKSEFNEVKISDTSLNRLSNMLLSSDPGKENDYPIMVATFASTTLPTDFILSPIKVNKNGYDQFIFVIGSIVYCIYDAIDVADLQIKELTLKENGTLIIHHFNDADAERFLKNYAGIL